MKILIRETKRLQALGEREAAKPYEEDIEVVVSALKVFGLRYNIASMQAMRADRYRKSSAAEMAFMEGDTLEEHAYVGNK